MDTQEEIEQCKQRLVAIDNKTIALSEEFERYKKAAYKSLSDTSYEGESRVMLALLPILDDLERAMKAVEYSTDIEATKQGVNLIYNKMKSILSSFGLEEMK